MAGTLVTILPKTDFTLSSVGSSAVETVLARALNVAPYTSGVLVARLHTGHTTGTGQAISILVRNTAPTPDDPSTEFTSSTVIGTVSFTNAAGVQVGFDDLTAGFSPFIKVVLSASQTTQNTNFTAAVSVDLVLRE